MQAAYRILWLAVVCALAAAPALAQTTLATITGVVTDPSGAAIPRAAVTATHVQSNYRYSADSNEAGMYTLAQLREGEYTLEVQVTGFSQYVARNILLVARDVRRIDVRLVVGAVATKVEVSGGATLIETESARISDTKTADMLKSLPLNTRSLIDFLALTAGVLQESSTGAQRRYAGSRINQSDASIDGISISDLYSNSNQVTALMGYVESFEEVRVDMANNTAEFGTLGMVGIVSKGGTNKLHGSLFDYYSTPWFRSRNPFALQRATGIQHAPGGSIGAPIRLPGVYNGRDKSFFFFSFETSRGNSSQDLLTPTVPLPAWRDGDFSGLLPGTTVKDPLTNVAFPGNKIPTARINSVSKTLQDRYYPLPNFGSTTVLQSQNYRELKIRPYDPNTYYTTRIDHRFSEKSSLMGRWTWNRSWTRNWEALPTLGQSWSRGERRGLTVSYTRTLRPNLLNEFRSGFVYSNLPRRPATNGKQIVEELGLKGLAPDLPDIQGMFRVSFSGLAVNPITVGEYRDPGNRIRNFEWTDQVSWFHGRHSVKSGVMIYRAQRTDFQANANLFGNVTFTNRYTGQPYADFLLGIPSTAARAFPPILSDNLRWAYDFFVTDEFRLSRRLTLNAGLRYEYHPFLGETSGLLSIFDMGTGKIVVPDGSLSKISPLLPRGYVDVIEAKQAGLNGKTLLRNDRNNFAPRLGLAYRPWGNDTVFRAGFGVYYDASPGGPMTGGGPYVINEPAQTNPATPTFMFPVVYPASVTGLPTTMSLPPSFRTDFRIPFSLQYNATIEHARWNTGFRLSYIGTATRQGQWYYNINQPLPDDRPYIQKPRRFPNYANIDYNTNGSGHQYHSMTIEAQRRLGKGLSYQASWVWARDIGDLERSRPPENAYDRQRERGVWQDIPTHRIAANAIYELPFGKGKHFLKGANRGLQALAGGWQISAIYTTHSGQFLTPTWNGPDPVGISNTTSTTPANVTGWRPNILRDPNLPEDQRSVIRWFDVGAFSAPVKGSFGTSAKGVVKGPGMNLWHGGLSKSFTLTEKTKLRWELIASNIFNHPNWSNPAMNISAPAQVGVITAIGGVSGLDESVQRSLRASLRLEW
jgi:hypothetical protein